MADTNVSRRDVLASGTALLVAFVLPGRNVNGASSRADTASLDTLKPNAWVRISRNNEITILTETPELGQGTRTGGVMALADELEVPWDSIRWEQAPTNPAIYKNLTTGGSGGMASTYLPMRKAGAQAREILLTAAAQQWGISKKECRAETGAVVAGDGRRIQYGDLVEIASTKSPIDLEKAPLKDAKEFRLIGKPMPRVDTPSKVDGTAVFGLDVRPPGLLFAVIARCPHFGGKLISVDTSDAKSVPGVKAVFAVPGMAYSEAIGINPNVAEGVAVVANSTWAAIQGRKALNIKWDKGPGAQETTAKLQEQFREKASGPPTVVNGEHGDVAQALESAHKKVEADYEMPFQAHATMEPMNTTVHVKQDGTIEVWSPTQGADLAQGTIAHVAGVPDDKVTVHMTFSGGSFGRRYQWDYLVEAYTVAKKMNAPVQLLRTREDDMQHDFYLQYSYQRMSGALDEDGNISAWSHRIVSTPIRAVFDSPEQLKDPKHVASYDVTDRTPYRVANYRSDYAPVSSVVPRAWWRSVSSPFHIFAIECFVDELAHAAGEDPLAFRLKHLTSDKEAEASRYSAVLRLAAERADWGKPLARNEGRGIACALFGATYVAHVAEVSVNQDGQFRVKRVVSAVDCGLAVNPDSVRAQIEGAINFGLTPVLGGEITVKEGAIEQNNFNNYRVLRMANAPDVEVHLVPANRDPANGVGESGVPPVAPAVANAIFAATGKRVRRLPINKVV